MWHPASSTAPPVPTAVPSSPHPYSLPRPLDGNSPLQRDYRIRPGLSHARSGPGHTCSALAWLFKNQTLSAKYHRWALRLIQYDIELQWRPGTKQQYGIALSWPKTRGATIDDSFPGDSTTKTTYRSPQGPVLDGVPLGQLNIEGFNNNNALPLTVLAQSPSHPTCRPQTPTQSDTDPVPTHWIPHRCSQKL